MGPKAILILSEKLYQKLTRILSFDNLGESKERQVNSRR